MKMVFDNRGKIYDKLSKNKVGMYVMTPFVLSYGVLWINQIGGDKFCQVIG